MTTTLPSTTTATPVAPTRGPSRMRPDGRPAVGFLAPFLILYVLFVIGPALYGLLMSFFDASLVRGGLGPFAGLANYGEVLTSSAFWAAMWHTVWFTVLTTPPLVVLGFVLALLAERAGRARWFLRLAFFAPYILPSAVMALIWMWIYTPELGLGAAAVSTFGLEPPSWLGDPDWAMVSLAIATVWWTLGFNFVLYLAGLQEVPRELYESAALDGATPWQQTLRITVPLLARTTTLVVVLQVIASLKVFDQMYIMTSGGPNGSTRPALEYVYDVAFTDYRIGYAGAASTVYFVLILAVSAIWYLRTRRQQEV
ncbi:carbohydrate ABC transporter permease [Pseudonocardia sp. CA-107938]|uniref:carbohydrate ABC transporter permease n=1 Tax=Pseudonocardia sp. CA-107938 TaxID=3240021 RepID=UPI003D94794A